MGDKMSFLNKLLDGVAAEWRTLGELTLPTSNIKWKEVNRSYKYIDLTSVSIETKAILETSEVLYKFPSNFLVSGFCLRRV